MLFCASHIAYAVVLFCHIVAVNYMMCLKVTEARLYICVHFVLMHHLCDCYVDLSTNIFAQYFYLFAIIIIKSLR